MCTRRFRSHTSLVPCCLRSAPPPPQVLRLLVRLYKASPAPDLVDVSQCLMFLDEPGEVAVMLDGLLQGSEVGGHEFACNSGEV